MRKYKDFKKDIIEGLNFVIRVKIKDPQFAGAVKRELTNNEVKLAVKREISKELYEILKSDKSFLDDSRAVISAEVRNFFN